MMENVLLMELNAHKAPDKMIQQLVMLKNAGEMTAQKELTNSGI